MPTIICQGFDHARALSDVLRLFYGTEMHPDMVPDQLSAANPLPLINSRVIPAGPDIWRVSTSTGEICKTAIVDTALIRREARRQLYQVLAGLTGIKYPWGSLTGVRPTVIAADALSSAQGDVQAAMVILRDHWFVAPDQAQLAVDTLLAEEQLLQQIAENELLMYVGIPFCPSRCTYCSFITEDALRQPDLLEPFTDSLLTEITRMNAALSQPLRIAYLGGGTPTSLPDHLFARLLEGITRVLTLTSGSEFTVEAGRPDTISLEKLRLIKQAGATRICINPQTFHDRTLQLIGRQHTAKQTLTAIELAREQGFQQINLDLIAGMPGESPVDFLNSLQQALQLQPESITVHALAVKRSSQIHHHLAGEQKHLDYLQQTRPQPAWQSALNTAKQMLAQNGLLPYYLYRQKNVFSGLENVGFAAQSAGSLYNVGMMSDRRPVLGLGCGAASKGFCDHQIRRRVNPRQASTYIAHIDELIEKKIDFFNSVQMNADE